MLKYICLWSCPSTNDHLKAIALTEASGTVVYTHRQTAGRGQRGNTWVAAPGMNATFSYLLRDTRVPASRQFVINEAIAIATAEALDDFCPGVTIKWPNDIYHCDLKLAGTLIEHSLQGAIIDYSVVGIGINVLQRDFGSGAPNPVSLSMLTDSVPEPDVVMRHVCERIDSIDWPRLDMPTLHRRYMERLYRNDGHLYPWRRHDGVQFLASIEAIGPMDGMLTLRLEDDSAVEVFAFEQIKHVIGGITR